jgi:hypothetical protein
LRCLHRFTHSNHWAAPWRVLCTVQQVSQSIRSIRAEEPVSPEQTDVEDKVEEVLSKTHGELWRKWGAMGLYHRKAGRARTFYSIPLFFMKQISEESLIILRLLRYSSISRHES